MESTLPRDSVQYTTTATLYSILFHVLSTVLYSRYSVLYTTPGTLNNSKLQLLNTAHYYKCIIKYTTPVHFRDNLTEVV